MTQWQPIATAPKDGTWILAYRPPPPGIGAWDTLIAVRWCENQYVRDFIWPDSHQTVDPFTASTDDDRWIVEDDFYEGGGTFTHWMPVPAPPEQSTTKR